MISINNKSTFKTLSSYLSAYRTLFYKRSFNNFVRIICAILCLQEVRSIKFIYEKFISKYWTIALNSFYYFLADEHLQIKALMLKTVEIGLSLITEDFRDKATIYLLVDDTLQAKFGKQFDCYSKLFDHANHTGSCYLNGHCFVSLAMSIPIIVKQTVKYITIPVGYKLYDKSQTKLELAAEMVENIMSTLNDYQVIVLCDSWYTKKPFVQRVKAFSNADIIGALRSDTVMYDLKPPLTGKKGRPAKHGSRLSVRDFGYAQEDNYFFGSRKVLTNLIETAVWITITTTDTTKFTSTRLYMSTIPIECIKSFADQEMTKPLKSPCTKGTFSIYRMRWSIEVMFYQQKTFWSFGNYMVRSQSAIEKYVNLVGVTYSLVTLLPFLHTEFKDYQFQSIQDIKYSLSEKLTKELIFSNLLETLQLRKNDTRASETLEYLIQEKLVG